VRLSPTGAFIDMSDSDPAATFGHAAAELGARRIAYLHLIEAVAGPMAAAGPRLAPALRARFGGAVILNGGYGRDTAEAALAAGEAELISFGAPFLANPDLPARLAAGAALNAPDPATFYTEGAKGYVDYPHLGEAARQGAGVIASGEASAAM
jgi:N-ethylmaleimide reductase